MTSARSFDNSKSALAFLQEKYGSANYSEWQSVRRQFYSYVQYPLAGQPTLTFFGDAVGSNGVTRQLTNMPKSGTFGQQHFLLKSIQTDFYCADFELNKQFTNDASVLNSDFISGLFQAGVFTLGIGERSFVQIPKPFLYAPGGDGNMEVHPAGLRAITLAEGTPNTFSQLITVVPHSELADRQDNIYLVDPNILIEAEQSFTAQISYDSGALAVLATTVIDSDNPLYVGVLMDGIVFRPVQ